MTASAGRCPNTSTASRHSSRPRHRLSSCSPTTRAAEVPGETHDHGLRSEPERYPS